MRESPSVLNPSIHSHFPVKASKTLLYSSLQDRQVLGELLKDINKNINFR